MDPVDSEQGQETPSEQGCDVAQSSRGRQRKKNPKYLDYETDDTQNEQSAQQKQPRRSSGGRGGAASKRTPAKSGKALNDTEQAADGEGEATEKSPQESDGKISEETPKKPVRARKTPKKRTPARKTPAKKTATIDGGLPAEEGGVTNAVQQENGTPKRKYVRKKRPAQEVKPVTEPPCTEGQGEPGVEPEEEIQPGGRRRRGAAKAALKYLHDLAKEVFGQPGDEPDSQRGADSDINETDTEPVKRGRRSLKGNKGRKGKKRKRADYDSDPAEDEDFVPDAEDEAEDMEDEEEEEGVDTDSDSDLRAIPATFNSGRTNYGANPKTPNGLQLNLMRCVWDTAQTNKKFREEHFSSWVFPAWVPSTSDWHPVPQSDVEKYLPQERQSAAFKVSRHGLSAEEEPLQRLNRFSALPAHPDRWDMLLYAGGPVWALEWCPTPDGAPASQYIALSCHRGMDDRHHVNKTYTGTGLVQLWNVSKLEYNSRPDSQPVLSYGLAMDKGFIWHLKWCPAGGWEPPSSGRKAPFLPRLGLLAVASSTSVVTIYSLPHPEALLSSNQRDNSAGQQLPIYKAKAVLTLKLGSFKAPRHEKSGQVLSLDWLPEKPHNIMAIGFYDGVVGLWDLTTKSALLRIREPDKSLSLLPYRCFLAHDHAVRALVFCPATRYLLATAGEDRLVKTWDLRRLYRPITALKRFLTNEICWPVNAPGIMMAQENAYAAIGLHGVHYFDHFMRSIFAVPRTSTLWSISYSDWLNCVLTTDSIGDVIFSVLPQISNSPQYIKRTLERRFPVYLTSMVPYETTNEENQETGGAEKEGEEGDTAEDQGGGETEGPEAASEGGNENTNENGREQGRGREDKSLPPRCPAYRDAVRKYWLHLTDNDMGSFAGSEKRAVWKRMRDTEVKAKMNMDETTLSAIHKVRFNPNMCCHTWLVTAGQTGLVRLHCLRSMISSQSKKIISENQAQFNALYSDTRDPEDDVQTVAADT